jgi:hypothetical protein
MPKITKTAHEQSTVDSPIDQVVNLMTQEISISTNPVFICGVNRKINIGNFENIDVYAGITLPLGDVSLDDKEALQKAIEEAAAYGFSLASKETGERYTLIKESQQGK